MGQKFVKMSKMNTPQFTNMVWVFLTGPSISGLTTERDPRKKAPREKAPCTKAPWVKAPCK